MDDLKAFLQAGINQIYPDVTEIKTITITKNNIVVVDMDGKVITLEIHWFSTSFILYHS